MKSLLILKILLVFIILQVQLFANNEALEKVSLQLQWKHQFEFAGFYIAKEKGFYRNLGLDVEIKELELDMNTVDEVLENRSTYGTTYSSIILEKSKGKDLVLLSAILQSSPHVLVSLKSSGIKSIKDFKDKRIMIANNNANNAPFESMLHANDISIKDMTVVKQTFKLQDLIDKKADISSVFSTNELYELDKQNIAYDIWDPKEYGFDFYDVILFTSQSELDNNPQRVKKFNKASLKGWEYAFENIEETVELILKKYNTQNKTKEALIYEANALKKLAYLNTKKVGDINKQNIKRIYDMYNFMGLVKNKIVFDDFIYNPNFLILNEKEKAFLKKRPTITVHNELNWMPYNYNKEGVAYGYSIDFIKLLASKLDINLEFVSGYSWSEFLDMIKNEKLDVMLNIVKTKNREKFLSYTTPYHKGMDAVFTNKNSAYNSLEHFEGKTLAVVKGFFEEEILKAFYPNIKLILTSDSLEALKLVSFGKADGAIDNLATGNSIILQYGLTNITPSFDVKDKRFMMNLRMATNKNNTILRDILEKAKQQITEYELRNMKQKWFLNNKRMDKNTITNTKLTVKQKEYLKNKEMITMCIDPDWMPFERFDEEKNHVGLSKDYFDIFEKQLGIPIKAIYTKTWNQSLDFARMRKCDILSLAMETKSRKEYMNFTKSYLSIPLVLATKMDVTYIDNMKQLSNKKVGLVKGYALNELLKKKYPYLDVVEVKNTDDGLQKVVDNKIYGFIGGVASIGYSFQNNFIGEVKISAKLDESWELGVAVRDDDLELFNIFENVIRNLSQDTKQKIFNKYIAIKNDKRVDYKLIINILIVVFIVVSFFIYRQYVLKKTNNKLEQLQVIVEDKSSKLQKNVDTMSKYIVYSRSNIKGIITDVSDAFIDISQYSKEELIGKPHNIIRDSDMSKCVFEDMWNTISSGDEWKGEIKNRKKDGSYYWVEAEMSPEFDKKGNIKGYVAISYDITAKKDFEKQHLQLIQSEKLASMGEMIGNIAHQWRQPLSVISSGASGIQLKAQYDLLTDQFMNETCEMIVDNAIYLSKTIDTFRDFIKGDSVKSMFELENTINSFLNLMEGTRKEHNINVVLDLQKDIKIDGYENELSQCFINIFNNAKEELIKKDTNVSFGSTNKNHYNNENKLIFISTKKEANNIIIEIKDNGTGIPVEILPKIFEPYFTTKHQSQGTGLGLHMTYNLIVNGMNGMIEAKNISYEYNDEKLLGAAFTITLPIKEES